MSSTIPFTKMSGSGNDFVVIDNRDGVMTGFDLSSFTRAVCRHRVSVGADGVVLIERPAPSADVAFAWRYINADGSDGEMCGNGAMCGARFAVLAGIAPPACRFRTASGIVAAEVAADVASDPRVAIAMPDPGPVQRDVIVAIDGKERCFHAIVAGVPHAVMIVPDADVFAPGIELEAFGRAVRHHAAFAPAGVNVNVVSLRPGGLRMRTYERGVEAETLACGTGAVASAVVATALGLASPPVDVLTSGGRSLIADFRWDGTHATHVRLQGEARVIATGEICPEAWG